MPKSNFSFQKLAFLSLALMSFSFNSFAQSKDPEACAYEKAEVSERIFFKPINQTDFTSDVTEVQCDNTSESSCADEVTQAAVKNCQASGLQHCVIAVSSTIQTRADIFQGIFRSAIFGLAGFGCSWPGFFFGNPPIGFSLAAICGVGAIAATADQNFKVTDPSKPTVHGFDMQAKNSDEVKNDSCTTLRTCRASETNSGNAARISAIDELIQRVGCPE